MKECTPTLTPTYFQRSSREAGVGAAQVAGKGSGALHRSRGKDLPDRGTILLDLQGVGVGVRVPGVGRQLFESAVGAV